MRWGTHAQLTDLRNAEKAILASTTPARVALLLDDTSEMRKAISRKEETIRKFYLATIDGKTSPILTKDDCNIPPDDELKKAFHAPNNTILLVIVENDTAPSFELEHLRQALSNFDNINFHRPPVYRTKTPPDVKSLDQKTVMNHRDHPLLRSSQVWYRTSQVVHLPEEEKIENKRPDIPTPASSDKLRSALAMLGELPKGLRKHFASYNEKTYTRKQMERISNLIVDKTTTLFKKDEEFHKWRKKG